MGSNSAIRLQTRVSESCSRESNDPRASHESKLNLLLCCLRIALNQRALNMADKKKEFTGTGMLTVMDGALVALIADEVGAGTGRD